MDEHEILRSALAYDDAETRKAYVAEACGADSALRRRVERLLSVPSAQGQAGMSLPVASDAETLAFVRPLSAAAQANESPIESCDEDPHLVTPDISFLEPSTKPGVLGRLGHYEIEQILGAGAFGIVFKAFDRSGMGGQAMHRHRRSRHSMRSRPRSTRTRGLNT